MDIEQLSGLPTVKKVGLYADYDPDNLHKDVLYITTDTKQILLNNIDYTFKKTRDNIKIFTMDDVANIDDEYNITYDFSPIFNYFDMLLKNIEVITDILNLPVVYLSIMDELTTKTLYKLNRYYNDSEGYIILSGISATMNTSNLVCITYMYIDSRRMDKINTSTERICLSDIVTKKEGKGLSTNDFTNEYKDKLDNLQDNITIPDNLISAVTPNVSNIWLGTEEEYNALTSVDDNTLYFIQ